MNCVIQQIHTYWNKQISCWESLVLKNLNQQNHDSARAFSSLFISLPSYAQLQREMNTTVNFSFSPRTVSPSLQIQLLDSSANYRLIKKVGMIAKKFIRLWSHFKVTFSFALPSWLCKLPILIDLKRGLSYLGNVSKQRHFFRRSFENIVYLITTCDCLERSLKQ